MNIIKKQKNIKKILVLVSFLLLIIEVILFKGFNSQNSILGLKNNESQTNTANLSLEQDDKNVAITANVKKVPIIKEDDTSASKASYVNYDKKGFDFSEWNRTCEPFLVVVNKDNFIPKNYDPQLVNYEEKQINKIIENDLTSMIQHARKDGVNLYISSGYRSSERQTVLFNNQVAKCKKLYYKDVNPEIIAATVVAKPGTSEHHTGLAIDFNGVNDDFYKTPEYSWLIKNGPNYGFILRYDKNKQNITNVIYEPWHFRYVGKEHAKKISQSGLCLEEYIESLIKN